MTLSLVTTKNLVLIIGGLIGNKENMAVVLLVIFSLSFLSFPFLLLPSLLPLSFQNLFQSPSLSGFSQNPTIWLNKMRGTDNFRNHNDEREAVLARWGGLGNHRYQVWGCYYCSYGCGCCSCLVLPFLFLIQ